MVLFLVFAGLCLMGNKMKKERERLIKMVPEIIEDHGRERKSQLITQHKHFKTLNTNTTQSKAFHSSQNYLSLSLSLSRYCYCYVFFSVSGHNNMASFCKLNSYLLFFLFSQNNKKVSFFYYLVYFWILLHFFYYL